MGIILSLTNQKTLGRPFPTIPTSWRIYWNTSQHYNDHYIFYNQIKDRNAHFVEILV